MRVQAREKCVFAKWRGVEKCSVNVRGVDCGEGKRRTGDIADSERRTHGG